MDLSKTTLTLLLPVLAHLTMQPPAWREELCYRVDWLKGPSLADDREDRVSIMYTRDPGPPVLPAGQFCAPAWAVPTGGEEPGEEEVGSLPDLHEGTESEGSS
jgi:hypothetical protein